MNKRLVLLGTLFLICFLAPTYAQKWTLKLGTGIGYASGGDFSAGVRGLNEYAKFLYDDLDGEFRPPHLAADIVAGEVLVYIRPRLGFGIGAGFLQLARSGELNYNLGDASVREKLRPVFSAVPIQANVHYRLPLPAKLNLDFNAGVSYVLTKVTWQWEQTIDFASYQYTFSDRFTYTARRGGIGFQAGVSLEYPLSSRIGLFLQVTGRAATIKGFKGSWTEQGGDGTYNFNETLNNQKAWYYDWEINATSYGQIVFQEAQPAGPTFKNVGEARLNLSGIGAVLGIKIRIT
jgi:hypothetical protein